MKRHRYGLEMNLKFVCSEKFELADKICNRMQGYLPNLISKIEVVRNDAFRGRDIALGGVSNSEASEKGEKCSNRFPRWLLLHQKTSKNSFGVIINSNLG